MPVARSRRQSRRTAIRAARLESPLRTIPFRQLHNPLPPLEICSPEQIDRLHQASMDILENIGLEFMDDEALTATPSGSGSIAASPWKR